METKKERILFVCVQNTFRSQVAEAIMNKKYGDRFIAESAGLNPGEIHPIAVKVMQDYGVDISHNETNSVFDFYKEGRLYSYVITVCSREAEKGCPIFPGIRRILNWPLPDPSLFEGTEAEQMENALKLRAEIEARIDEFVAALV